MGLYFSWGFGPALLGIRHLVYLRVACENSWVKLETCGIHGYGFDGRFEELFDSMGFSVYDCCLFY